MKQSKRQYYFVKFVELNRGMDKTYPHCPSEATACALQVPDSVLKEAMVTERMRDFYNVSGLMALSELARQFVLWWSAPGQDAGKEDREWIQMWFDNKEEGHEFYADDTWRETEAIPSHFWARVNGEKAVPCFSCKEPIQAGAIMLVVGWDTEYGSEVRNYCKPCGCYLLQEASEEAKEAFLKLQGEKP